MNEWQTKAFYNPLDKEIAKEVIAQNIDFFSKRYKFANFTIHVFLVTEIDPMRYERYWHSFMIVFKRKEVIHPKKWSYLLRRKQEELFEDLLQGIGEKETKTIEEDIPSLHIRREFTHQEHLKQLEFEIQIKIDDEINQTLTLLQRQIQTHFPSPRIIQATAIQRNDQIIKQAQRLQHLYIKVTTKKEEEK